MPWEFKASTAVPISTSKSLVPSVQRWKQEDYVLVCSSGSSQDSAGKQKLDEVTL